MTHQHSERIRLTNELLSEGKEFGIRVLLRTADARTDSDEDTDGEEVEDTSHSTWVFFKARVKRHTMSPSNEAILQGVVLKAVADGSTASTIDVARTNVWLTFTEEPPADSRFPSTGRDVSGIYFTIALSDAARTRAARTLREEQEEEGDVYTMMFKWTNSEGGHYYRIVNKDGIAEQKVDDFEIFPWCERCNKRKRTT